MRISDWSSDVCSSDLVRERGAEEDRVQLVGERRAADGRLELLDGELALFEVLLHDLVVSLGEGLEKLHAPLVGLLLQLGRDGLELVVLTDRGLATPGEGANAAQVRSEQRRGGKGWVGTGRYGGAP